MPRDFRPRSASPISRILLSRWHPSKPRLHERVEGIFAQAPGGLRTRAMGRYEVRRLREMRVVVGVLYWFLVKFLTSNVLYMSAGENHR